jgi:hypothetical protein
MMHPFLEDPENARAYAHLLAVPIGSLRTWAKDLNWSAGKLQRFIAALRRYRLGSVESCKHNSVFRPLNGKTPGKTHPPPKNPPPFASDHDVHRSVSDRIDAHRCASAAPLGSSGLVGKEPSAAGSEYSNTLITAMNAALSARFLDGYRPVLIDNKSSIEAAHRLEHAGVPADRAVAHLEIQCRLFNPSKHGKGELPRSLAYFERGILKAWRSEAQLEIPLMQLERASSDDAPRYPKYVPPAGDRPIAKPESIDAGLQEFRSIANSPTRPRRA